MTTNDIIAAAILNARGMRRGAPTVSNVLEFAPPKTVEDARDDAANVITELENAGYEIIKKENANG